MINKGYNLLLDISGPAESVANLAYAVDCFTDDENILNITWMAGATELTMSAGSVTARTNDIYAGANSTYALVCSRPDLSDEPEMVSWHLKSDSDCAAEFAVITKWFAQLNVVVVEQQVEPTAGALLYLTYYSGEREVEYRMSKAEASRRATPGPRKPPPCPRSIAPRRSRVTGADRANIE
jgi:hypothetical protein